MSDNLIRSVQLEVIRAEWRLNDFYCSCKINWILERQTNRKMSDKQNLVHLQLKFSSVIRAGMYLFNW